MTTSIEQRVARGVKYLDAVMPDWFEPHHIDVDQLHMSDTCNCVLGQIVGRTISPDDPGKVFGYYEVVDNAGERYSQDHPQLVPLVMTHNQAVRRGFHLTMRESDLSSEWRQLTETWRRVILARRQEGTS